MAVLDLGRRSENVLPGLDELRLDGGVQSRLASGPLRDTETRLLEPGAQRLDTYHVMTHKPGDEIEVLGASGHQLRYSEIVDFEAETGAVSRILIVKVDNPITPTGREDCRVLADSVGVVAEDLMKRRPFAN